MKAEFAERFREDKVTGQAVSLAEYQMQVTKEQLGETADQDVLDYFETLQTGVQEWCVTMPDSLCMVDIAFVLSDQITNKQSGPDVSIALASTSTHNTLTHQDNQRAPPNLTRATHKEKEDTSTVTEETKNKGKKPNENSVHSDQPGGSKARRGLAL